MRSAPTLSLVLCLTAAASACRAPTSADAVMVDFESAVAIASRDSASYPRDPVRLTGARLQGDLLELAVEYGGGCAEHRFQLVAAGGFQESFPVQLRAFLSHDAGGDPCDAIFTASLVFDLEPIAEAYRRAYRSADGRVLLTIDGLVGVVDYRF